MNVVKLSYLQFFDKENTSKKFKAKMVKKAPGSLEHSDLQI